MDDEMEHERSSWDGDRSFAATLASLSAAPGSTSGGPKATLKFEIGREAGELLMEAIGEQAFDVTFAKSALGDGFSVSNVTARPDADGAGRCFVTFVVPENQVSKLGLLFKQNLIGRSGDLLLGHSQVTMEDLLAKKAE